MNSTDVNEDITLELQLRGDKLVGKSVIDAMRDPGESYAAEKLEVGGFCATDAEPGSREKLAILAHRIQLGLPLWHPNDRHVEDGPMTHEAQLTAE